MSSAVPQCTHVKTNGEVCGSPAISGAEFCFHHSTVKTALAKGQPNGKAPDEGFAPIPFVFPEDRASMQINFFLLLQAFNEQRIDHSTYKLMLSMLKAMAKNLGKTGSLVDEARDQCLGAGDQERGNRQQGIGNSKPQEEGCEQQEEERGEASEYPIEFSPELMARFEEIESLSPNDPSYAERIRAAVAEGTKELKAQGLDLIEISPAAGSQQSLNR